MLKKMSGIIVAIVAMLTIVGILAGANKRLSVDPAIENVSKNAVLLNVNMRAVVDEEGQLKNNALENYEKNLKTVFSKKSIIPEKDIETMKTILGSYDEKTDVVLDNSIVDYEVREYEESENEVNMVVDIRMLQKYIPCYDEKTYKSIICVSNDQFKMTLIKEDGVWKVENMNLIQHDFGSPKDLKLSNTDFEKEFTTRKEACQYLKSLDTKDILK